MSRKSGKAKGGKDKVKKDEDRESLAFKILPAALTQQLLDCKDVLDVQEKIVEFEKLQLYEYDLKDATEMDYFVSGVWWCKEKSYDSQTTSALYTVLHTLLDNIREKHLDMVENLVEFKKMFSGIGLEGGDISGGLEFLDITQATEIMAYVKTSLFQHYTLYKYMYSHKQAEEIIGTDLDVEVAKPADMPWPPPLDEGVPIEIYQKHIATPPPTPPPKVEDTENIDGATGGEPVTDETNEKAGREAELLASLSPEEIKQVMEKVAKEMLGGLQSELSSKLKERETSIINRINKIHKVDSS